MEKKGLELVKASCRYGLVLGCLGFAMLMRTSTAHAQSTSGGFGGNSGFSSSGGFGTSGFSSSDIQKAQNAARNGLSEQEMDSACQAAVSKHMSSSDVDGLAKTLGMSPGQTAQLMDCVSRGGPSNNASANPNPMQPQLPVQMPQIGRAHV